MSPKGFTLIEMTAVILIMGLLAGGAVLSLAHTVSAHRFNSIPQQLQQADALLRSAARQSGRSQKLVFDLEGGRVLWQTDERGDSLSLVRLGGNDVLTLRTADQELSTGQATIEYSEGGYSPSYALCLSSPGNEPKWLIFAGLTGRTWVTADEKEVETIFQTLQTHSPQPRRVDVAYGDDTH